LPELELKPLSINDVAVGCEHVTDELMFVPVRIAQPEDEKDSPNPVGKLIFILPELRIGSRVVTENV
jgi:hypothetical protein